MEESNSKLIKVCRVSGLPIKLEHIEEYDSVFKQAYNNTLAKLGIIENMPMTEEQSIRMNKLLTRVQKILLKKYPVVGEWNYLETPDSWVEAVKHYGPITCAINSDTGGLAYIIMDEGF